EELAELLAQGEAGPGEAGLYPPEPQIERPGGLLLWEAGDGPEEENGAGGLRGLGDGPVYGGAPPPPPPPLLRPPRPRARRGGPAAWGGWGGGAPGARRLRRSRISALFAAMR